MNMNTGNVDRILRVIIGVVLLSALFWVDSDWRWVGLVGLVPLLTGLFGWCAIYAVLGIGTRGRRPGRA
jgi:hypothetical protein